MCTNCTYVTVRESRDLARDWPLCLRSGPELVLLCLRTVLRLRGPDDWIHRREGPLAARGGTGPADPRTQCDGRHTRARIALGTAVLAIFEPRFIVEL